MNKNQLFTSISLLFTLFLFSCQKPGPQIKAEELDPVESCISNTLKISKESVSLTKNDAMKVALMFSSSGSPETRGGVDKTVKSVIPVEENGEALLYGVNFEDGYLLISGTKNYYPILAEIEHGYFDGNPTGTGADILLAEIKDNIKAVNANPELRVNRSVWNQYEELIIPERQPATRSGLDDELYDLMYGLGADGWTVYSLANQPQNMPNNLYQRFCDAAYDECGEDPDYDYMYYTFIAEKTFINATSVGPLLSTTWDQGTPYNLSKLDSTKIVCAAIAAGQIMRYHEHPDYSADFPFTLNQMPNSISTYDYNLCDFLANLESRIGLSIYGSAFIDDVKTALEGLSYSCAINTHNTISVCDTLSLFKPIYMRGYDYDLDEGHAWVCDGYSRTSYFDCYKLYVFRYDNGIPSYYDEELSQNTNYYGPYSLFHMNWGWGGWMNGSYFDTGSISNNYFPHYYLSDRKNLYISPVL